MLTQEEMPMKPLGTDTLKVPLRTKVNLNTSPIPNGYQQTHKRSPSLNNIFLIVNKQVIALSYGYAEHIRLSSDWHIIFQLLVFTRPWFEPTIFYTER